MAATWPLQSFLLVILLIFGHPSQGKKTESKADSSTRIDAQKAHEVHEAVSTLLEHKIGKKLKEAATEVKQAVDKALGKHLDNAHHILQNNDADVIVMDPKLSKLVKTAVKDGKKQPNDKSKKAKTKEAHDFPPPSFHHAKNFHAHHQSRYPTGGQQPFGGNRYGLGYGGNLHPQGYGGNRHPQGYGGNRYPQGYGGSHYPQRYGSQLGNYQQPGYPQTAGQHQTPNGYQQTPGYSGYPGYPQTQGYPASPGYPATTQTPGYPPLQGFSAYPATQGYLSPMPGAPGQPYGGSMGFAQGYGGQQSPFMANGCSQSCSQNCYLMCPRKCCSDKREAVAQHKKSKVHHKKHSKKRARIHRKNERNHHKHH